MHLVGRATVVVVGSLALLTADAISAPVGTAFTYQGQLKQAGVPVDGPADFTFSVWTAEDGGAFLQADGPMTLQLADGLFTAQLELTSAVLTGNALWLEVGVRRTGDWTTLSPRQRITPTPYALSAQQAEDLQLPFAATVNTAENAVTLTQTGSGKALSLNKSGGDEPAIQAIQSGTGPCGEFLVNNVGSSSAAVVGSSIGSGPGVHGRGLSGGAAVEGTALGSGRAAFFLTEYATNENPTVYAEQRGGGRCTHFRITNANNDLEAVAASTTGGGIAVSGYTIGEGPAGKFQINNVGSDAPAVYAMTNGTGYAIHADSTDDVAPAGGGVVMVGREDGNNIAIDGNEIMARSDGATSTLYMNNDGGDVVFGGTIDIGYEVVRETSSGDAVDAWCPPGKKVIGGGCNCGTDDIEGSYPAVEEDRWKCYCSGDISSAQAICARVK